MYLLDTNIISGVKTWLESTDAAMLYTSAINIMELERGILRMERKDQAQGQVLRAWLEQTVKPPFCICSAFSLSDGLIPYLDGQRPKERRFTPLQARIKGNFRRDTRTHARGNGGILSEIRARTHAREQGRR